MSAEFDGRPLAVGVVRGIRSFNVDDFGRLTGINYPALWRPGENKSACYLGSYDPYLYALKALGGAVPSSLIPKPKANPRPGHSFATCTCGFYAYYDGSDDYRADARVSAVVEGYGEVLIGTRGFRADKARIVALCIPRRRDRMRNRASLVGKVAARVAVGVCAGETGLMAVLRYIVGDPILGSWLMALAVLGLSASFFMPIEWPSKWKRSGRLTRKQVASIRRNYADVPVFGSFKAMVAAFPPDKGLEPSPETDPHFWGARP